MKWVTYTRGTIHPHRMDQALIGIYKYASRLNEAKFDNAMYVNIGDKMWFVWNEKEIKNVGYKIIKKCSNKNEQKTHLKKMEKYANEAIKETDQVRSMSLNKLTDKELIGKYNRLTKKVAPAHGLLDIDIDAIDIVFENFLQAKIKRELKEEFTQAEFANLYNLLTVPLCETYVKKEEKDIIKYAIKNEIKKEYIDDLYDRYWWTNLGWESIKINNRDYFKNKLKKYKNDKNLKSKLEKLDKELKNANKVRKKLLKKYNLSKEIDYWLKFADQYNKMHDLRKEMQVKTIYAYYLLMTEVAKRLHYDKNDLEWLYYYEIKELLEGKKLDKKEIERRQRAVVVRIYKDKIKYYSGKEALKIFKREIKIDRKKTKEIKGLGVSVGKIKASVKICNGAEEALKKIKKGDVLVCGMTLPEYVPAMKKSAAIITNEGGITCHAAIISRELGIPCVVGTKIATEVLKNGDRVEVDADRGIIRKL